MAPECAGRSGQTPHRWPLLTAVPGAVEEAGEDGFVTRANVLRQSKAISAPLVPLCLTLGLPLGRHSVLLQAVHSHFQ